MSLQYLALVTMRGLLHRQVWEANRSALSEDIITNNDLRTLVHFIGELHDRHEDRRDLTLDDLHLAVESKYRRPDGRKEELLEIVEALTDVEDREPTAVQPFIADFLGRELAGKAAMYIGSTEESEQYDLAKPLAMLTRAIELRASMDLDVDELQYAPPPDPSERPGVCTVGLGPTMDMHLGGGIANGEMLILLAPPGVGKTSLLKHMGIQMAKQGEHVLDITLEISGAKVRQRLDQSLTGFSRDERFRRPDAVVAARKALAGKYYVKDWCSRNVTVDDIRTLVFNMRVQGKPVSVLSVDYLELMSPLQSNRFGARFDFSQVAKNMRQLSNELGVKLITAWQVNRIGSTKHVIGKEDVSECWDIIKHADDILGLNQGPEELLNYVLRINVLKQRESTARPLVTYYSNLDRMILRENTGGSDDGPPQDLGAWD